MLPSTLESDHHYPCTLQIVSIRCTRPKACVGVGIVNRHAVSSYEGPHRIEGPPIYMTSEEHLEASKDSITDIDLESIA